MMFEPGVKSGPDMALHQLTIQTVESVKVNYLLQAMLIRNKCNILAVGATGTGKTVINQAFLSLDSTKNKHHAANVTFCSQTSANQAFVSFTTLVELPAKPLIMFFKRVLSNVKDSSKFAGKS